MSTAAKLTLAGTSAMAVGIVFFVHYSQKAEKTVSVLCCLVTIYLASLHPMRSLHGLLTVC